MKEIKPGCFLISVIVILVLYAGYIFLNEEKSAIKEAQKAQHMEEQRKIRAAVAQMVSRTNANTDWEKTLLHGQNYRPGTILTVELESLWLQSRPILFHGLVKDISTMDNTQYVVVLKRSVFNNKNMFDTELHLSLNASKEQVDSLRSRISEDWENPGFAVVARINSIRSTSYLDADGFGVDVRIGNGDLIDFRHIGFVEF